MKVLIVDDSAVMRTIVERGLRQSGAENLQVRHAANGAEGLAELEQAESPGVGFDLILSDIHMPVMDGTQLLAEVRRRGLARGVPVVLITAQAEGAGPSNLGDFQRLVKPFTLEQMRARLGPLLHIPVHG
ncbi:MAG: response regulator [Acidobacteriaceae bacterium]